MQNSDLEAPTKWLDLVAAGFNLTSTLHNSGKFHLFVLTRIGEVEGSVEEQLREAAFREFSWGFAAPVTRGNARVLSRLPGATVTFINQQQEAQSEDDNVDTEATEESDGSKPSGNVRGSGVRGVEEGVTESGNDRQPEGPTDDRPGRGRGVNSGADRSLSSEGTAKGEGIPEGSASRGTVQDGSGEDLAGSDGERDVDLTGEIERDLNPRHFHLGSLVDRSSFNSRERFQENLQAIRVLKALEADGREATDAEKADLVRYSGWGGLSKIFDRYDYRRAEWEKAGAEELEALLTTEEFESARASVNNSHFTPPEVVKAMWSAVNQMGFAGGRVLEPGMGVGNFFGLCPGELTKISNFHGVEIDGLTGRIARCIYPDAEIRIEGFETSRYPDGMFDLVIGNVPFGTYSAYEERYAKHRLPVHDQFIVKSLDLVKPGGIVALVSSSFTLDKEGETARMLMHKQAYFAGAFRLPKSSFAAQAGTETTVDILFFVRRHHPLQHLDDSSSFVKSSPDPMDKEGGTWPHSLNDWLRETPQNVLGQLEIGRGLMGASRLDCVEVEPWAPLLRRRLQTHFEGWRSPERISTDHQKTTDSADRGQIEVEEELPEGSLLEKDGKIYRVLSNKSEAIETDLQGAGVDIVRRFILIRDTLNDLFRAEMSNRVDMEEARKKLNHSYEDFVGKHGPLNLRSNRRTVSGDPACGKVMALESFDADTQLAARADIFSKRVINPRPEAIEAENAQQALLLSLDRFGFIDLDYMSALTRTPQAILKEELHEGGFAFPNPEKGGAWEAAADYLSGDVRTKLHQAQLSAAIDPVYKRNVNVLESIQPQDLGPADIHVRLGAPWVDPQDVVAFASELLDLSAVQVRALSIQRRAADNTWVIESKGLNYLAEARLSFGTDRRNFFDLLERGLNNQAVTVYDKVDEVRVLNVKETAAAQEKLDMIQQRFRTFLWDDEERSYRLLREYNQRYNSYVPPKYDGSHLSFPGMSATLKPRKTQCDAIWRALHYNTLFNHEVGTGKTLEQVATLLEGKRIGKWTKPCWIVPNHMLEQAEREARQLYPAARILAVTKKDLSLDRRSLFMGRCANNDWDIVIIPHSIFPKISVPKAFEVKLLRSELVDYRMELEAQRAAGQKGRSVKQIESKVKSLEGRIKKLLDAPKDDGIDFGELGLDALCVDESHNFKNLAVEAPGTEVQAGINGSKRAWDLYVKSRWLYDLRRETSGVYFASGTPVSNNVLEVYNQQRLLQPEVLNNAGLSSASAWASTFLSPRTAWEPSPSGDGWKLRTRYTLVNVPELMQMLRMTMDVVTAEDAGIPKPDCERINVSLPMSDNQRRLMRGLSRRVETMQKQNVDPSVDNILKIVSEGRRLSLDERLLRKDLPANSCGKVAVCAQNLLDEYRKSEDIRGTQLVFCDLGTPKPGNPSLYGELKKELMRLGIHKHEIAFIHDASTDDAKALLFQQVRSGRVRILIGSTAKMGEGTNVQERIVAIHDMDPPWRATDIEQRGGRGVRYGNINKSIRRYIYTTEDTFDVFMWHTLKHKAELFSQVLKGDASVREITLEVDPTFAETAAITSNNVLIKQKLEVEAAIAKLEMSSRLHVDQVFQARKAINSLRRERQEKEAGLRNLEAVRPTTSPKEWTFDLAAYGHTSSYKGDRQGMLDLVKKLVETQGLKQVAGMACGGIQVAVRRTPDGPQWRLGEGKFVFDRAGDLERFLHEHGQKMKSLVEKMGSLDKQIRTAQTMAESTWGQDNELVTLRAQQREILTAIEEDSKRQKHEDDDLSGDWLEPEPSPIDLGEVEEDLAPTA